MTLRKGDWTPEEDEVLIDLVRQGMSHSDIVEQIKAISGREITNAGVMNRIRRLRSTGVVIEAGGVSREPGADLDPLIARMVAHTKKSPVRLEELCDLLDLSPRRMRELIKEAGSRGFNVQLSEDHVGRPPSREKEHHEAKVLEVSQPGKRHTMAIVGDVHFGSKHHLAGPFRDFCDKAYARGARHFLQVGDLLDGSYKHSLYEQDARGFEEQVALAIKSLPKYKGAQWHFIQGNHDETLGEASGIDVGRAIVERFKAAGRNDLTYHGARGAYVRLRAKGEKRGIVVELWHPRDRGNAYALTYRLQKKIEGYAVGAKPDIVAAGHWHQSVYFSTRGVHALSAGAWQGSGSSFAKSLATSPANGSWIVEWSVTKEGTIREFVPQWFGYYEKEIVRSVEMS